MKILINGNTVQEHIQLSKDVDFKGLDKIIGHLKRNKKIYTKLIFMTAFIIPSSTIEAYAVGGTIGICLEIYEYIKEAVYGICLLGAASEGIKCVLSGTVEQLGRIATKYTFFALMIKFLPNALDIVFGLGGK